MNSQNLKSVRAMFACDAFLPFGPCCLCESGFVLPFAPILDLCMICKNCFPITRAYHLHCPQVCELLELLLTRQACPHSHAVFHTIDSMKAFPQYYFQLLTICKNPMFVDHQHQVFGLFFVLHLACIAILCNVFATTNACALDPDLPRVARFLSLLGGL